LFWTWLCRAAEKKNRLCKGWRRSWLAAARNCQELRFGHVGPLGFLLGALEHGTRLPDVVDVQGRADPGRNLAVDPQGRSDASP